LRELVRLIPPDRLLIETDAPYLLPRTLKPQPKGRRNEPAFLPHVAAAVADATGRSAETIALQSAANARRLFRLG
jgi:TatD DNase family protein